MNIYKSLAFFKINEKDCFVVQNDIETNCFSHLLNKKVSIDGVVYKVIAVETNCHTPPFLIGEKISLMVEKIKNVRDLDEQPETQVPTL